MGRSTNDRASTDYLTVIALSLLAYTLAVLLHEHLGHGLTCAALGGHLAELARDFDTALAPNCPRFDESLFLS